MTEDRELAAMQTILGALNPLEEDARSRVMAYIVDRLEIDALSTARGGEQRVDPPEGNGAEREQATSRTFHSFAELFDATSPNTNPEKALVAGYWVQVCQAGPNFTAHAANKQLKHLGHGLPNITGALDDLKELKPAQVLQLQKSGKTCQTRKTYKLSHAGIKTVQEMIGG
jgi:hypothetical protein